MCAAVDEEIELKLYNVFHIRTDAVANGDEANRIELLANLLYLYDESWNLEKEGVKVLVGSHQEKTHPEPVKTIVFKKVKKWLMLAELGHLVTGDISIVESKKFRRLMTGMMDRLEHKLGMEGLKARVREVARRQARLSGKENFKSPARLENKRLSAALQQSPLVTVSNKLNSSTVDDTNSPDNAKIPTGKQLPRTPPNQFTTNQDTSSILGISGRSDSSSSPSTSRMSSFYSPNVSTLKNKVTRKDRVKVLASASDFDDITLPTTDKKLVDDNDKNSSSSVPLDISNTDLPPPGRQLPRTPAVPITTAPARISPEIRTSNSDETSTPSRNGPVATSIPSPPVPAVAKLLSNQIQHSNPEGAEDREEEERLDSDVQEDTPQKNKEERSDTPDLPLPPTPVNISRNDTDNLPLPSPPHIPGEYIHLHAPDRAVTPPVSDLVSRHLIPTGRQLLSTPHLQRNKQEVQVEPSGKYELPVELEQVAIPSRQDLEDRAKHKVEEEERRQRKAKEEVERKVHQKMEAEKKLEIAEFERVRIEESLKQQKEREKLEEEKIMIEKMKEQLLEKAKILEEKEKQLKEYEVRKQEEERKFEEYRRKKEDEDGQQKKLKSLKEEEDRLAKEEESKRKEKEEKMRMEEEKSEKEERRKEEEKRVDEEKCRKKEDRCIKEEESSRMKEEKTKQEKLSKLEEVSRRKLVESLGVEEHASSVQSIGKDKSEEKVNTIKDSNRKDLKSNDVQKKTSVGMVLKSSTIPTRKRSVIKDKEPGTNLSEVGQENEALKETSNTQDLGVLVQDEEKKAGQIKPPIATEKFGQVAVESREEKSKRKPIRIGRRTGKVAGSTGTEKSKLVNETNVLTEKNTQTKVNQLEEVGSVKKVVGNEVDDDESALYIVDPGRKSGSKSLHENSKSVESSSRVVKRKSVNSVIKPSDVSPTKKGKGALSKNPLAERVLRGRKKLSDIHPLGEGDSAKKNNQSKETDVIKVPRKSTKKQSVHPPCLDDESSLQDKLEKRRKHIDETIQNPESAISASKLVKSISSTEDNSSLQKKLKRQRKIVDEASENPTPVKVLVQQSKEVLENESNDTNKNGITEKAPAKKVKTTVSNKNLKNKIELPVVEDDNSLMTKLNKRRKKIEEKVPLEDLTFSNKLPQKGSVPKNTDEPLAKGGNKKEDVKQNEGEMVTSVNSAEEKKPSKVSKKDGNNDLDVSNPRKSSDDQDYFTAAEESLHLPRPRRNCKKKFDNLEGLASANSSASNTPTPGPSQDSRIFQFLDSKPVDDSRIIVNETDRKKPGRKPRSLKGRTTDEIQVSESPSIMGELKVVIESPLDCPPQKTIKKHLRTSKRAQTENEEANKNLLNSVSVETNPGKSSKSTARKSKAQVQCVLSEMDDEVYKTPSCKIPDELYQTPQPMGSFSHVQDEEYKTPQETQVRKSRRRQKK